MLAGLQPVNSVRYTMCFGRTVSDRGDSKYSLVMNTFWSVCVTCVVRYLIGCYNYQRRYVALSLNIVIAKLAGINLSSLAR